MKFWIRAMLAATLLAGVTLGIAQTPASNTATWTWAPPTEYSDGTPIASGTVITYNVYTGSVSGEESSIPAWTGTALTATTSGYADGSTVYGNVTACVVPVGGTSPTDCSPHSNEASKNFPLPAPVAPTLAVK
jgi:hypothetical protein